MGTYRDYLIRRLVSTIMVWLAISLLIFFISRVLPGDPARLALGPAATQEQVESLREEMGLNDPLYVQYLNYLKGALQGDLGKSLLTHRNVASDLMERLPASIELTTVAIMFAVLVGVPLGVISAMKKDKIQDHVSRGFALIGVCMPRFWVGILLQILVYLFVSHFCDWPIFGRIGVAPPDHITGLYLIDSLLTLNFPAFKSALEHLVLPALTLSLASIAQVTRITRAAMIEERTEDYIVAAEAHGLPRGLVVYQYMLKNAFTATLTVIGVIYAYLLGNAFLVEAVFAWPGIGGYGVKSILQKDFNALMGVTMVMGLAFLLVNLLVDLLYGFLDPRIKYGE